MHQKHLTQNSIREELFRKFHLKSSTATSTHWGWVMHICIVNLTMVGSDNGLSPGRRQAIIWTNAWILLIEPLGTNFSEILIKIHKFSFKKMHLKMLSAKWQPFCLGLNVLTCCTIRSCTNQCIDASKVNQKHPTHVSIKNVWFGKFQLEL